MNTFVIGAAIGEAVGFAACWYFKDKIMIVLSGAATYARDLEARAAQLRAKL